MNYKLVGFASRSGTLDNGNQWSNVTFYMLGMGVEKGVTGNKVYIFKAPSSYDTSHLELGNEYAVLFDQFGKVQMLLSPGDPVIL